MPLYRNTEAALAAEGIKSAYPQCSLIVSSWQHAGLSFHKRQAIETNNKKDQRAPTISIPCS